MPYDDHTLPAWQSQLELAVLPAVLAAAAVLLACSSEFIMDRRLAVSKPAAVVVPVAALAEGAVPDVPAVIRALRESNVESMLAAFGAAALSEAAAWELPG